MLHAALLAAALGSTAADPSSMKQTPAQQCLASMDGAVYHGDPTDRALMKANVAACTVGVAQIEKLHAASARGPEKLFIIGRIIDRAATLSYIGLGDADTALAEVRKANLYFRVASGLTDQSADYHAAAVANAELTAVQLQTLRSEVASAARSRAALVAVRTQPRPHEGTLAAAQPCYVCRDAKPPLQLAATTSAKHNQLSPKR